MSGHSKWSTIKRKKGAADQKKGAEFSKLIKAITAAVREGGADADRNARLRTLIDQTKAINMPNDTLKKAIDRGSGTLDGVTFNEMTYEGYGPQGVAIIIETLSDNKNRTTAEVRHILSKYGGQLGETGCVSWMFTKKGLITVASAGADPDKLMEIAIDSGAEDVEDGEEFHTVTTSQTEFDAVKKALEEAGFKVESAEISMEPQTTVAVDEKHAATVIKIMNMLEDHDDVQNVYSNFDIADEIIEKINL